MSKFICTTCGVQHPERTQEPESCPICIEERQFVNPNGQEWTTLIEMRESGIYKNNIVKEEENLYSITTAPEFGIGQTAYLVKEDNFTILWDCITYIDQETIDTINELGGVDAIALSHPHYYSAIADWAEAFDVPIYIHADDKEWIIEPTDRIVLWEEEQLKLHNGLHLHRLGGHFTGGAVLHWSYGNEGKGTLLTGDIIQVVADRDWVSFMYSYPNLIPLPANKVADIASRVENLSFDRIYNAFHKSVHSNANEAVQRSAQRYIKALNGTWFTT